MAPRAHQKPTQGTIEFRKAGSHPTWGGRRKNAGRKKKTGKRMHVHGKRARMKSWQPQHVTLRLEDEVANVRRWRFFAVIVESIAAAMRSGFRIHAWSVQNGHLHLIVEAGSWKALSNGVRGLEIRLARAINRVLSRLGRVFADRYYARALTTPTEVRNALVYVLQNARKHLAQRGVVVRRDWLDKFSSAAVFDGWADSARSGVDRIREELGSLMETIAASVRSPETWLLKIGWRRRGLLRATDIPASS